MKRFIIGFGWLMAACVAVAGTGKRALIIRSATRAIRTRERPRQF